MKEKIFLSQLGDYFDVYLPNVRRASSNTIAAYGYSFSIFFEFLYEEKGIPHSSVTYKLLTPALFDEFILWMTNVRKYSAASVRQRIDLICIRNFLGHEHIGTTEIYARVGQEAVTKALTDRKFQRFPLLPLNANQVNAISLTSSKEQEEIICEHLLPIIHFLWGFYNGNSKFRLKHISWKRRPL